MQLLRKRPPEKQKSRSFGHCMLMVSTKGEIVEEDKMIVNKRKKARKKIKQIIHQFL